MLANSCTVRAISSVTTIDKNKLTAKFVKCHLEVANGRKIVHFLSIKGII